MLNVCKPTKLQARPSMLNACKHVKHEAWVPQSMCIYGCAFAFEFCICIWEGSRLPLQWSCAIDPNASPNEKRNEKHTKNPNAPQMQMQLLGDVGIWIWIWITAKLKPKHVKLIPEPFTLKWNPKPKKHR